MKTWKEHIDKAKVFESEKNFFSASIEWRRAASLATDENISKNLRDKAMACDSQWKI